MNIDELTTDELKKVVEKREAQESHRKEIQDAYRHVIGSEYQFTSLGLVIKDLRQRINDLESKNKELKKLIDKEG